MTDETDETTAAASNTEDAAAADTISPSSGVSFQDNDDPPASSENEESVADVEDNQDTHSPVAEEEGPVSNEDSADDCDCERANDADTINVSLGVRIRAVEDPSGSIEDEASVADVEENADEQTPAEDWKAPPAKKMEKKIPMLLATKRNLLHQQQMVKYRYLVARKLQLSYLLHMRWNRRNHLGVLLPKFVGWTQGIPPFRMQFLTTPNKKAKIRRRRDRMKWAAMYWVGTALVAIILGSTLGRSSSSGSSGGEPTELAKSLCPSLS